MKVIKEHFGYEEPPKRLWFAVIERAVHDALGTKKEKREFKETGKLSMIQSDALYFLRRRIYEPAERCDICTEWIKSKFIQYGIFTEEELERKGPYG